MPRPTVLPRQTTQAARLAVTLPLYSVGLGLSALSTTLPALLYAVAVARWLFVVVGIVLLLIGIAFDQIVVAVLVAGLVVAVVLWVLRVRAALRDGLVTEPAAMVVRSRQPETEAERAVQSTVERLCQTVGQRAPAIRIRETERPLCFTVRYPVETSPLKALERDTRAYRAVQNEVTYEGAAYDTRSEIPERRVLVVSTGVLDLLTEGEVTAVLAHEVAHLANRDLALMNWLLLPVFWGDGLVQGGDSLVGTVTGGIIAVVTLLGVAVFTRGREFTADAAAAEITGDPAALASALEQLSAARTAPERDLRSVSMLNVLPPAVDDAGWFDGLAHPSTERRIARLRARAANDTA